MLAGTACSKLLHSLEELFRLPESEVSQHEGAHIATTKYKAPEYGTPEEAMATMIEKPTASGSTMIQPNTSAPAMLPPPIKRRKVLEMIA